MADQPTMAELLQAPTEGYGDAIVTLAILAENFELKHGLLNLVTSKQFCGFENLDLARKRTPSLYNNLDALTLIENKSKVHTSRNKPVVAKVSTNTSTSGLSPDVAALIDAVKALLLKNITAPPASIKAVDESCVNCGGPHPYYQCLSTDGKTFPGYQDNIQAYVSAVAVNYNQGNVGHPCEEYSQEVLGFSANSESGNPTLIFKPIIAKSSPSLTLFEGGDFILEEIKAYLASDSVPPGIDEAEFDPDGDIRLIEEILNNVPYSPLPSKDLKCKELKSIKSSVDEPPKLELKDLPSHLEKLNDATRKDHFLLPFMDQMLERLAKNEYYCFLDGFSRCMMAIFHDMIEETMEVFMDDFSVFKDSFSSFLSHLDKMFKRCEDTNLVLNWEKCHFMLKEGVVLGHKISKSGIQTTRLSSICSLSKMLNQDCSKWILHLQEFDVIICDKNGVKNLAAGHLSRVENPHQSDPEKKEITETFYLETLGMVTFRGDSNTSWFADIANYHAGKFIMNDYLSKWVEAKALPTNAARVVVKFLKSLFARFGTPRAIISDRGTNFCNDQFAKVMLKYRVTYRLSIAYHP
nr:reverse transcriptase domain-containing protein [Tanacetum cinerariifolium]